MTGADPNTSWFDGCVALDDKGFIKTGLDLSAENLRAAGWPLTRQPYLLETSLPGIFAVGYVRVEVSNVHSDTYDEPIIERYHSQCYSYVILPFIRMSIDYALIGVMRDHNQDRSRLIITLDGRGKDQMSKLSSFIV
jgi:hypothetical protein